VCPPASTFWFSVVLAALAVESVVLFYVILVVMRLQRRVAKLEADKFDLQGAVGNLHSRSLEQEKTIATQEKSIADLRADIAQHLRTIAHLKGRITRLNNIRLSNFNVEEMERISKHRKHLILKLQKEYRNLQIAFQELMDLFKNFRDDMINNGNARTDADDSRMLSTVNELSTIIKMCYAEGAFARNPAAAALRRMICDGVPERGLQPLWEAKPKKINNRPPPRQPNGRVLASYDVLGCLPGFFDHLN
jgi:uncharacterized coiled-coil protein SlyX